jgi:hypothetical protein
VGREIKEDRKMRELLENQSRGGPQRFFFTTENGNLLGNFRRAFHENTVKSYADFMPPFRDNPISINLKDYHF